MSNYRTIDELIDLIDQELTIGGSFTRILPLTEIRRLIETKAQDEFYRAHPFSTQKAYYYINKEIMLTEEFTRYKSVLMPDDVQHITWLWEVNDKSLISIGLNTPNLSINMGVSNQPYLQSFVSTIGDIGVYKVVLDSFSDMLNQLSKQTVKHDYNEPSRRLNILGGFKNNLICEAEVRIEKEYLYADVDFVEYCTGLSLRQLGMMLTRYDYTLAGNVKMNGDQIKTEGSERIEKVLEKIKGMGNSSFMIMVRR